MIWNSRSESFSWSGASEEAGPEASISAKDWLMYLPPELIFRIALISSSGTLSFIRYPDAPAFSACRAKGSSSWKLMIKTGRFGHSCFNCFRTSNPLVSGRLISSKSASQGVWRTTRSTSSAFTASPATCISCSAVMICLTPRRTTGWSSTIITLIIRHLLPDRAFFFP